MTLRQAQGPSPAQGPSSAEGLGDAHGEAHGDVSVDELRLSEELAGAGTTAASADIAEYALWLGDDALILSQQLGAWISRAPELEEDVALGNIALDLLGHARSFLHFAGTWDGRSEDDLAYFRDEPEFRSAWIVEQPNGDFAQTIARQLVASVYLVELYAALRASSEPTFAAIAEKALKEVDYHRDHAVQWVLRLAGGTEESRRRMIRAFADVWLGDVAVRPSSLRAPFDAVIATVFAEAELTVPEVPASSAGGRNGAHATPFGHLLAEMQVLARRHPGASW